MNNLIQGENRDDPDYTLAAEAAASIINLYVGSDEPKAILFGKILFTILAVLRQSAVEHAEWRNTPSLN